MRKTGVLFLMLVLMALHNYAQMPEVVHWNISTEKGADKNETKIRIVATIDSGWHIFAENPGGDGLLIPTSIKITVNNKVPEMMPPKQTNIPQKATMDGVGEVYYYENNYTWENVFGAKPKSKLKIIIEYQCCNDKMCLPPKTIEKNIIL